MSNPSARPAGRRAGNQPSPTARGDSVLDEDQIGESFHRFQALKGNDYAAAVRCFAEFKTGIARRIRWEEAEIYPEFLQRVGGGLESTCDALRQDHREVVKLLEGIEAKLNRSDPATEAEETELRKLLAAHNHREHSIVFPALE